MKLLYCCAAAAQFAIRNDMDKLERDTKPNNGWTIKFATLKALREQAQEMGENPTEEEVEAVALAMVNLGYALIEMPNPVVRGATESRTSPPRCSAGDQT